MRSDVPSAGAEGLTRRGFLFGVGGFGLFTLVPPVRLVALSGASPAPSHRGRFLTAHELDTLRVVTAVFIPGPPVDPDPGAIEAGCAEAIDLLLAAFSFDPPLIHAGGPFSDRAGSPVDDMAHFVPLDDLAELGWRIRLEGSRGIPAREFNGPVVGLQQQYKDGLALFDRRAQAQGRNDFLSLSPPQQGGIVGNLADNDVQAFVAAVLSNTLEAMYGPPEYGGNHNLSGWTPLNWPGDVQPRGYTPVQVSTPGPHPLSPEGFATLEHILGPLLAQFPH